LSTHAYMLRITSFHFNMKFLDSNTDVNLKWYAKITHKIPDFLDVVDKIQNTLSNNSWKMNFNYITEWIIAFQMLCPCEVQILLSTRNLLIQLYYVYIYIITRLCILKPQCQLQEGLQTHYNFHITWTNKVHYLLLIYFNSKTLHVLNRLAAHQ